MNDCNICIKNPSTTVTIPSEIHQKEIGVLHGLYEMRDEDNAVIRKVKYENGKREGPSCYYHKGHLYEIRQFHNDVGSRVSVRMDDYQECGFFLYENDTQYECVPRSDLDGYYDVYDFKTRIKLYCCKYDSNKEMIGKCYVYKNGNISKVVEMKGNLEERIYKIFEGNTMTEFDENNVKIYSGCFKDDVKEDYCREGKGCSYRNEEPDYCGEWKKNVRHGLGNIYRDGKAIIECQYDKGSFCGVVKFDKEEMMPKPAKSAKPAKSVKPAKPASPQEVFVNPTLTFSETTTEEELLKALKFSPNQEKVREIIFDENAFQHMRDGLCISGFKRLEKIVFKRGCLQDLRLLKISQNPNLTTLEISDSSSSNFFLYKIQSVELSGIRNVWYDKGIDLPKLESLWVHQMAFKNTEKLTLSSIHFKFCFMSRPS